MELPSAPGTKFSVFAKPNASATEHLGYHDGRDAFVFRIASPARDGAANEELLEYLRDELGVACEIVHGHASKKKLLRVRG